MSFQSDTIKVLLADDSGFMRLVLKDIFEVHKETFTLLDTAEDGNEVFQKTKLLKPDIVLLDLMMPEYDGLYAVEHIMRECPTPILLLTAAGNNDMHTVFEALDKGAFDFLIKPGNSGGKIRDIEKQLLDKVKYVANVNLHQLTKRSHRTNNNSHTFDKVNYDIVVMGASTGGTGAIEEILKCLPDNFPVPIVIAQHMPQGFIVSFADRLDKISPLQVKLAKEGEVLRAGIVYVLSGEGNMIIGKEGIKPVFRKTDKIYEEYNNPSVDALFVSAAEIFREKTIAVILSGMGKDGTIGMSILHQKKAFTIAQNEKTSIVFGMPKEAIEKGAINYVLPVHEIGSFIVGGLS